MPSRSKSRSKLCKTSSFLSFKTGNMLTHPSGDQVYREQSKLLQARQKNEKDLWMLNKKHQFMKEEYEQLDQSESETDIQVEPKSPRRRPQMFFKIIKGKKILCRAHQPKFEGSDSEITSEEQEPRKDVKKEAITKKYTKQNGDERKIQAREVSAKKRKNRMMTSQELQEKRQWDRQTEKKRARFYEDEQ